MIGENLSSNIQRGVIFGTIIRGPVTLGNIRDTIVTEYGLDDLKTFKPFPKGLQSRKFSFANGDQRYLLKIYPKKTSREVRSRLGNMIRLEQALRDAGVPVSETIQTSTGRHWSTITEKVKMDADTKVVFSISRFFDGSPLTNPSVQDVEQISHYLAKIHSLKDVGVVPALDTWSLLRLA